MILLKKKIVESPMIQGVHRRTFLKYAGATAGIASLLLSGCKDKDDDKPAPATTNNTAVNLGKGDIGILNYAYALEQLEAAFYITVANNSQFMSIFSQKEQDILKDIRDHEIIHRDFFKTALGSSAIQDLEVDFSTIDFTNRSSVLTTAKTFEDLGVSAYNGAGQLIVSADYLLLAGKIVSVEARHASVIRDLLSTTPLNSPDFSGDDVVGANGLDGAKMPKDVLAAADPYIKTQINANDLPTS